MSAGACGGLSLASTKASLPKRTEIGGNQVEHHVAIVQDWYNRWWVLYNGEPLGYYPGTLFTYMNGLNGHACRASFYGEVLRGTSPASPDGPATEMGSGKFADTGAGSAAYVRNPMVYDTTWIGVPAGQLSLGTMTPEEPLCYMSNDFTPATTTYYLGGPGINNNIACVWP